MELRFNPAPGWPQPPEGWRPPAGWMPDPSWPDPPPDWPFWVPADPGAAAGSHPDEPPVSAERPAGRPRGRRAAPAPAVEDEREDLLPVPPPPARRPAPATPATRADARARSAARDGARSGARDGTQGGHRSRRPLVLAAAAVAVVLVGALAVGGLGGDDGADSLTASELRLSALEFDETATTPDALAGGLTDDDAAAAISGASTTSALAALAAIEVRGRAPRTGYTREQFGAGWVDVDGNGCDTRNDVLARDLADDVFVDGTRDCVVLSGTLAEPYAPSTIAFRRGQGTSELVQVDHVVALSDAWQKGAQQWDAQRRTAFANDPLNLLAVDGPLNAQKGDGDAATWLPPNTGYRCAYVARQVAVKVSYDLWMTQAELTASAGVLAGCPDEQLPGGVLADLSGRAAPSSAAPTSSAPAPSETSPSSPSSSTSSTTSPSSASSSSTSAASSPSSSSGTSAPTSTGTTPSSAPAPAPPSAEPTEAAPPSPSVEATPDGGTTTYADCDAVRAAGAAPVRVGDPGYSPDLDGDGDGTACEP